MLSAKRTVTRLVILLISGFVCNAGYSEPDPKIVARDCREKFKDSKDMEEIEKCIDKAFAGESKDPPRPSNAPATSLGKGTSTKSTKIENDGKGGSSQIAPVSPASSLGTTPTQALDRDQSYAGEPCDWFTKLSVQMVDSDGNKTYGKNHYSEGARVAYGKWAYKCVGGTWEVVSESRFQNFRTAEEIEGIK